jgi:hypothetical protein
VKDGAEPSSRRPEQPEPAAESGPAESGRASKYATAAESEPTAPTEAEEERGPADELRHNLSIHQAAASSIFNGPLRVGTMYLGSADGEARSVLTWWPLRDEFATPPPAFVEPPHFGELLRLLSDQHVVLLTGGGCGSVSVAAATLRSAKHDPIVELSTSPTTRELLAGIKQISVEMPDVGILVPSIGEDALSGFGAAELRRLRGALDQGAVIFTTRAQPVSERPTHALPTLEAVPPDAVAIVHAHAPAEPQERDRALKALELSGEESIGPGAAVALVDAARGNPSASPEELAELISGRSDALDEWVTERPTAEHVASLAAIVTLDGAPIADIDAEALRLHQLLEGELEPSSEPKRFGAADRGWPAGVVALCHRPVDTYFGVQEAEVAEICPPHRRERLLAQLWDRLGPDFRTAYIEWLSTLAEHPSMRIRSGAAVTAGILFAKEPITAERELLRLWALDGSAALCECAGLALGIPVLLGSDPAPARALAYAWSEPHSGRNRRHAAIAAYGGPLGAWDSGSAAPAHLWRIPSEQPRVLDEDEAVEQIRLRSAADSALAGLVVAGAEAGQVRAAVVGLLAAQAEERHERRRAFELLPRIIRRLVRNDELARASLAALLDDAEQASFAELAALLASAFDVPTGFASARSAFLALLDAVAAGRIDQGVVNRVIRAMKAGARPGRLSALGQQLQRILTVERRRQDAPGRAAREVHDTFFSTPQEVN